jgi:hypothetical protein
MVAFEYLISILGKKGSTIANTIGVDISIDSVDFKTCDFKTLVQMDEDTNEK